MVFPNFPSALIMPRDANFGNVSLLMHMNGANNGTTFTDVKGKTPTVGGSAITSTTQSKFNGSSAKFNGTDSYLQLPNSSDLDVSSADDFTAESWIYPTTVTGSLAICSTIPNSSTSSVGFSLFILNNSLRFESNGGTATAISGLSVSANQWSHVALSKAGTTYTFSINGTTAAITNSTAWSTSGSTFNVGATPRTAYRYFYPGYMAEFRFTKSIARTISTTPTLPFFNA